MRRDILKVKNSFNGTFFSECQKKSIPSSFLSLAGMLIKGPSTKIDHTENQACLSIAQLIEFNSNSRTRCRPQATGATHHVRSRESPLPYGQGSVPCPRDRSLIDTFYKLGLCSSYDRFLTVSTEITKSVVKRCVLYISLNARLLPALLSTIYHGQICHAEITL